MKNKIILYLKEYLNTPNINLEDNLKELLIKSEANKKNILFNEEITHQLLEHDGIFIPIDLQWVNMFLDIEKKFNINIDDNKTCINTVDELIELIKKK